MVPTLKDLDQMIAEAEKDLEELKAARRVMEKFGSKSSESSEVNTSSIGDTGIINLDDVALPVKAVKNDDTLMANIKKLVKRFGTQEFTVTQVDAVLRQMGKGSNAKHFKNRVSIIIRQLTDEGMLEKIFEGSGNVPHKYRLTQQISFLDKNGSNED